MTTINDILNIADQVSLKITFDNNHIDIKHKLSIDDKSIWGVLFFFFGGCFLSIAPFIKSSDTTSKLLGITIGLFFIVLSFLSLIRQVGGRLKITGAEIIFRHNLKRTVIPLSRSLRVKMKTEKIKIRRIGALDSDFIIVSHYLKNGNKEITILKFQMDNTHADQAIKLGNEITQLINDRIRQAA